MHSQKTGVAMVASCKLNEPQVVTEYKLRVDKKVLGKTFKAEQKKVNPWVVDEHVDGWVHR